MAEQWIWNQTVQLSKNLFGPTDSDYKIRDGSRFIEWGLAGEGYEEWKWHNLVGR